MVQTPLKPLTLDMFLALPETEPASEYIGGQITQKPMPKGKHSSIQTELATAINLQLKGPCIARAFSELRCTFGDRSIVPDISVFSWARLVRDGSGEIADVFDISPDWTIEILSPDQSQTKVTKNILHCLEYQTLLDWLIDPDEKTVFVYQPNQKALVFDVPSQQLLVPSFAQGLALTVDQVFGWLL
jgi:Uma2 family endonuclease